DAPSGSFIEVASGYGWSCALGTDHSVTCWGNTSGLPGTFTHLGRGPQQPCGIRSDGAIVCSSGTISLPADSYQSLAVGGQICGLTADGLIRCTDTGAGPYTPPEKFTSVSANETGEACGLHADGTVLCWRPAPPPDPWRPPTMTTWSYAGPFAAISIAEEV